MMSNMSSEPRVTVETDPELVDYMFDLYGYLILEQAISKEDLAEMNQWVDSKWDKVEHPNPGTDIVASSWLGNVQTHSYGLDDGVNFQHIVEGGPAFERLIDHPRWLPLVTKYVNPVNGLSIHENLLNVRGPGRIPLHSFRRTCTPVLFLLSARKHWGVDGRPNQPADGPGRHWTGDGPTAVIPGSHRTTEIHPRLIRDGKGIVSAHDEREAASTAYGTKEVYLKAGDALFFTDSITHGSAERINPGYRRVIIYRYSPRYLRTRFNYNFSGELLGRLNEQARSILQPVPPIGPNIPPSS